jgi:polyketide synthase PksL
LVIVSRRSEREAAEKLARIRASGATVIYRSADIVDRAVLKAAVQSLKAEGVTLDGVIHMARRVSDAPIARKDFREFRQTMAAKVTGAVNLDAVTIDEPLEFFLMYSSIAAFGIQGSPDYAFSAAYQNALARSRDRLAGQGQRSGRTRSICWGQWSVDGAVDLDQLPARLDRLRHMGMDFIDASSAMDLMESSLRGDASVTAFMAVEDPEAVRRALGLGRQTVDISSALEAYESKEWDDGEFARFLDSMPDEHLTESIQHRIIQLTGVAAGSPRNLNGHSNGAAAKTRSRPEHDPVRASIVASVKKTLKISENELDWDYPLQNYGLDSIIAMQLATTLEKNLKSPVEPRWLIEYPTSNLLLEKLHRELEG